MNPIFYKKTPKNNKKNRNKNGSGFLKNLVGTFLMIIELIDDVLTANYIYEQGESTVEIRYDQIRSILFKKAMILAHKNLPV